MQETKVPTTPTKRKPAPAVTPRTRDAREPRTSSKTQDAPALRYSVASLQHWLDLNA